MAGAFFYSVKLADLIQSEGYDLRPTGAGQLRSHVHDSLQVDTRKNMYYWHSKQGSGLPWCGDIVNWIQLTRKLSKREALNEVERLVNGEVTYEHHAPEATEAKPTTEVKPLPQYLGQKFRAALDRESYEWWLAQGIDGGAIDHFELGVCDHLAYGLAYTIPVYVCGELKTIRLRLANPADPHDKYRPFKKGYGSFLYNSDVLTPERRGVVVVAGEKKVIVLWQYGIPAVSSTAGASTWYSAWTEALGYCQKVYVCFDPTESAQAQEVARKIGPRARVVTLSQKPDDFILEHGVTEFRKQLAAAR